MEREGVREGEREGERERHREAHGSVLVAQHPTQVLDVLVVQGGSWGGGGHRALLVEVRRGDRNRIRKAPGTVVVTATDMVGQEREVLAVGHMRLSGTKQLVVSSKQRWLRWWTTGAVRGPIESG